MGLRSGRIGCWVKRRGLNISSLRASLTFMSGGADF